MLIITVIAHSAAIVLYDFACAITDRDAAECSNTWCIKGDPADWVLAAVAAIAATTGKTGSDARRKEAKNADCFRDKAI